jgi:hypothetical protein
MSARDAATYFRTLEARLKSAVIKAETESAREAMAVAVEQTSGTISTRQLRRMGHPYARRAPQTPVDPGQSNDQGGGVPQSWRMEIRFLSDGVEARIVNSHPDARWLKRAGRGNSKSVARPIVAAVLQRIRASRKTRLREAIRAALTER